MAGPSSTVSQRQRHCCAVPHTTSSTRRRTEEGRTARVHVTRAMTGQRRRRRARRRATYKDAVGRRERQRKTAEDGDGIGGRRTAWTGKGGRTILPGLRVNTPLPSAPQHRVSAAPTLRFRSAPPPPLSLYRHLCPTTPPYAGRHRHAILHTATFAARAACRLPRRLPLPLPPHACCPSATAAAPFRTPRTYLCLLAHNRFPRHYLRCLRCCSNSRIACVTSRRAIWRFTSILLIAAGAYAFSTATIMRYPRSGCSICLLSIYPHVAAHLRCSSGILLPLPALDLLRLAVLCLAVLYISFLTRAFAVLLPVFFVRFAFSLLHLC